MFVIMIAASLKLGETLLQRYTPMHPGMQGFTCKQLLAVPCHAMVCFVGDFLHNIIKNQDLQVTLASCSQLDTSASRHGCSLHHAARTLGLLSVSNIIAAMHLQNQLYC